MKKASNAALILTLSVFACRGVDDAHDDEELMGTSNAIKQGGCSKKELEVTKSQAEYSGRITLDEQFNFHVKCRSAPR